MALVFRGKTKCGICRQTIEQDDAISAFPPFVNNEKDDLYKFSDAAFHEKCVIMHKDAGKVNRLLLQLKEKVVPGAYRCAVCGDIIERPDDYFTVGYLTSDETSPWFNCNYDQFHRKCILGWERRQALKEWLARQLQSGDWRGVGGDSLVERL